MIFQKAILLFSILILALHLSGQEHINWEILADVEWTEEIDSTTGYGSMRGAFGETLSQYDGQEVYIDGYVIPLDAMGFSYALSRSSYASCFFCGQAGPETVLDLKVKPRSIPAHLQNNTSLKFKGRLVLREINPTGLNYILEDATLIE